jgi:hypothetical protein
MFFYRIQTENFGIETVAHGSEPPYVLRRCGFVTVCAGEFQKTCTYSKNNLTSTTMATAATTLHIFHS